MEEKETEIEWNKDESQKNKNWIKSLGFGNLPVEEWRTDEERWRTEENLHEFAYGNISDLNSPLFPFYRKKGEDVAAQLAQASWVAASRSNLAFKNILEGPIQNFKIAICTTHFDKFTPLLP